MWHWPAVRFLARRARACSPSRVDSGRRHLFIDIDGVVLGTTPGTHNTALAPGAADLIQFGLSVGGCSWLSTHGASGQREPVMRRLRPFLPDSFVGLFDRVEAARWQTLKTRALPLSGEFVWLDDAPLRAELDELERRGVADHFLRVDTRKDWTALVGALAHLHQIWR